MFGILEDGLKALGSSPSAGLCVDVLNALLEGDVVVVLDRTLRACLATRERAVFGAELLKRSSCKHIVSALELSIFAAELWLCC